MKRLSRILALVALAYISSSFIPLEDRHLSLNDLDASTVVAQNPSKHIYKSLTSDFLQDVTYHLDLEQAYTAIKITPMVAESEGAVQVRMMATHDTAIIGVIENENDIDIPPNFIIFSAPESHITLEVSTDMQVKLEFFYASPIQVPSARRKQKKVNCDEPFVYTQDVWRVGLPEPIAGREATAVKHVVIHHAAGSNTDTNYVNTIRNIYLLHTQSNGWDDIGYNYVIAQNGDIYAGRDHEGVDDQDNIKGAHFCSKNEGTMGVCMLGNYMNQRPSTETMQSLEHLLTWKLFKEGIQALDSFAHPNSGGMKLGSIAIHQDGCATSCPGDSTLPLLAQLKSDVQSNLDSCALIAQVEKPRLVVKHKLYPNPSDGRFYCMLEDGITDASIRLIQADGKVVYEEKLPQNGYVKVDLPNGLYSYQISSEYKLLIRGQLQLYK